MYVDCILFCLLFRLNVIMFCLLCITLHITIYTLKQNLYSYLCMTVKPNVLLWWKNICYEKTHILSCLNCWLIRRIILYKKEKRQGWSRYERKKQMSRILIIVASIINRFKMLAYKFSCHSHVFNRSLSEHKYVEL